MRRVVTAAAVAGTVLIVCLLLVIVYQIVRIVVLNNRIDKVEEEIQTQQEIKEQHENDLEYYLSDWYLEEEAYKHHFIRPGTNAGN
ncbi:MAG TPA: hypothetical protein IAB32_06490 [Candidatus Scatosoma pullicola]|nr:hypothetical protein [Candidatus Scatosoma pullicola]